MREFFFNRGGGKALADPPSSTPPSTPSIPTPTPTPLKTWYVVISGDSTNGTGPAYTVVKYVSDDTNSEYDKNKWTEAASSNSSNGLNTFLSNVVSSGDTVYIKAGEYKLSAQIKLSSKLLHLYGGFAGTETTSSDRNLNANKTTLDAQKSTFSVLIIISNSTIDGFTITGGKLSNSAGGGIYIAEASPTITNCAITDNTASNGGGIFIANASPTITNCAITDNTASTSGSGIYITANASPTITNCAITGNSNSRFGSGIYINDNASPTIINCTISGNTASKSGGGIHIANASPTITNCAITNNNTANESGAGGIHIYSADLTITNCTTSDNSGRGFYIEEGHPTIINCTISGNSKNGIYVSDGSPKVINCTIANNNPEVDASKIDFRNTLIWNSTANNAISGSTITYDHCAWPNATGENNIAFNTWENPVSSDITANGVTHKVYLAENNPVLYTLAGKGVSNDTTPAPAEDQIGMTRANPPSIGAAEIVLPILSADLTGTGTITAKHGGTAKTETFTPIVSLDNVALTTASYDLSWDVSVNPAASAISIDQNGKLTVGSATPIGTYEATVKAQAAYTVIKSNTAERKVNITVESGDITLTLTSQTLPNGKVNTAYTEAQYFTATATPSSADIAWEVSGLPTGLNFDKGKISGTPTASGDFSVKVTVTATLENYNTASKDITASLKIEAAPTPTPEPDPEPGENEDEPKEDEEKGNGGGSSTDDGKTITVPADGISGLTDTQKQTVETLILNNVDDLSQITATDFSQLTTVKISSNAEVGEDGELDLSSLPESVKTFSISGNTSLKNLNLKNSKVENIEAKNCTELESVDVSGNSSIVTLDVSNTKLKLLDASGCANLTSIDCSYCGITDLSIGQSPKLLKVDCSNNSILALDINSSDLNLTNLENLKCEHQVLGNWRSVNKLNFDDFVESPDIVLSSDSSVAVASSTRFANVSNLKAFDVNGTKIEVISDDNGNITFASAPDSITYDYNTGFKNTSMDVTVYSAEDFSNTSSSSGGCGGCNVMDNKILGLRNVLILLLCELALLKLKIKRS